MRSPTEEVIDGITLIITIWLGIVIILLAVTSQDHHRKTNFRSGDPPSIVKIFIFTMEVLDFWSDILFVALIMAQDFERAVTWRILCVLAMCISYFFNMVAGLDAILQWRIMDTMTGKWLRKYLAILVAFMSLLCGNLYGPSLLFNCRAFYLQLFCMNTSGTSKESMRKMRFWCSTIIRNLPLFSAQAYYVMYLGKDNITSAVAGITSFVNILVHFALFVHAWWFWHQTQEQIVFCFNLYVRASLSPINKRCSTYAWRNAISHALSAPLPSSRTMPTHHATATPSSKELAPQFTSSLPSTSMTLEQRELQIAREISLPVSVSRDAAFVERYVPLSRANVEIWAINECLGEKNASHHVSIVYVVVAMRCTFGEHRTLVQKLRCFNKNEEDQKFFKQHLKDYLNLGDELSDIQTEVFGFEQSLGILTPRLGQLATVPLDAVVPISPKTHHVKPSTDEMNELTLDAKDSRPTIELPMLTQMQLGSTSVEMLGDSQSDLSMVGQNANSS